MSEEQTTQHKEMSYADYALAQAMSVSPENPLKYLDLSYKTINPEALKVAITDAKKSVATISKKSGSPYDIFFTIGNNQNQRKLFEGLIGAMLYITDFIDLVAEKKGLEKTAVDTCKKVLRAIDLPLKIDSGTSCRRYSLLMQSFLNWMSSGNRDVATKTVKSNAEVVNFLTSTAMESFPAIPYASCYLGTVKSNDSQMKVTENVANIIDMEKYMSKTSIMLNEPKIVVVPSGNFLCSSIGHPLGSVFVGENNNGNIQWLGLFSSGDEFSRLCLEAGLSHKEVMEYLMSTTLEKHKQNLSKKNPIATFVENQQLMKQSLELRNKMYRPEEINEDEIDELLNS